MKIYELTYLISPEISEEELKNYPQKILEFLKNEGGEILEEITPTRKKLFSPIKKQRQAYAVSLSFNLEPEKIENFLKFMKSEPQILRFLISIKKLPRFKKPAEIKAGPKITAEKIERKTEIEKPVERKKVEIEEIEKKLAEILGEI